MESGSYIQQSNNIKMGKVLSDTSKAYLFLWK